MQAFLFLTALAAASAVDCRKRTIPDFLCLLTAAAGLISFSPAQFFGVLAALPLLIAALIRPECMGGGDIKLTAAAGFVLGFWRGIWGMALGLLLAVLYFCTAIRAALPGTVTVSQYNSSYGYYVIIDHGNGLSTLYGHNSRLLAQVGQTVEAGDIISLSGSTGRSTGPHLHFEVRVNGERTNPRYYLPKTGG